MKPGRWISFIAFLATLYVVWHSRQVLLLIFTAIVLTIPLNRLVRRWQQLGMQRRFAVLLSATTLLILLLLFVGLFVPPFISQFQQILHLVSVGFIRLQYWLMQSQERFSDIFQPTSILILSQSQPLIGWFFNHFFAFFSDVVSMVLHLILILILTVMLLANPLAYRRSLIQLVPQFYRLRIDAVLSQCEAHLVLWMQRTFWQMLIVGGATAIGLTILQIPFVFTNAALAGLLETIPHLGGLLSLVPPLTAAALDSPGKAVAVVLLYLAIQAAKPYFLARLKQPKHLSLLPAIMLLSQLSFAFVGGLGGLLLAVPIVIVGRICVREIVVRDVLRHG